MNTTAAPTSYLGIGKSLGSEIGGGRRGLYQVLAKGPEGKKDLGLRAIHTRIITHTQEPPALEDLLKKGHNLSSSLGITDVMFNNTLGVNLRHAFYTINELKLKFYRREVVETAFYLTLCQHGEHTRAQILRKTKLKVNPKLLAILVKMDHFLRSLKDTEPLSPEVIELATKI